MMYRQDDGGIHPSATTSIQFCPLSSLYQTRRSTPARRRADDPFNSPSPAVQEGRGARIVDPRLRVRGRHPLRSRAPTAAPAPATSALGRRDSRGPEGGQANGAAAESEADRRGSAYELVDEVKLKNSPGGTSFSTLPLSVDGPTVRCDAIDDAVHSDANEAPWRGDATHNRRRRQSGATARRA